ncbi:MAG: MinD/ParA family protein [Lachnospiraceae bacterium]|nr:MinD/ParA family protein [Lachnospiraceae bacterium]
MDQAEKLRDMMKMQTKEKKLQARIITVTSGKGGVGKSSISVNLALEFKKQGKKVIIFDADFGLANIEVMIGAIPKYNLADLIYKGKELKDIIVNGPMDIGFISGGSGISSLSNMSKEQVLYLVYKLRELENLADIIIIDTGAGISDTVLEFVSKSSEILLVATPEPTSITDSYALLKALNSRKDFDNTDSVIKVVANRVASRDEGDNLYNKLSVVVNKFLDVNMEYLGMIPVDTNMSMAVMQQKPITLAYPNSQASKSIEQLASKLLDIEISEDEKKNGIAAMFAKMFKGKKGGV